MKQCGLKWTGGVCVNEYAHDGNCRNAEGRERIVPSPVAITRYQARLVEEAAKKAEEEKPLDPVKDALEFLNKHCGLPPGTQWTYPTHYDNNPGTLVSGSKKAGLPFTGMKIVGTCCGLHYLNGWYSDEYPSYSTATDPAEPVNTAAFHVFLDLMRKNKGGPAGMAFVAATTKRQLRAAKLLKEAGFYESHGDNARHPGDGLSVWLYNYHPVEGSFAAPAPKEE